MQMLAIYLIDIKATSQIGFLFTYGGIVISSCSIKWTIVATSSNHAEIITLHEASKECVWLRSLVQSIQITCRLPTVQETPTILFEDNVACIAQIKGGYVKEDRTKHITLKFFLHTNSRRKVK